MCPPNILQYFVSFLQSNRDAPDPVCQYVAWCLDNAKHIQVATRKNPPSTVEITVSLIVAIYTRLSTVNPNARIIRIQILTASNG